MNEHLNALISEGQQTTVSVKYLFGEANIAKNFL